MIFKLQTADGWVFIDDIYNVDVRYNCFEELFSDYGPRTFKCPSGTRFGVDIVERDQYHKEEEKAEDIAYRIVTLFRHHDDPLTYAFNTYAYLLNDSGKTIERLY